MPNTRRQRSIRIVIGLRCGSATHLIVDRTRLASANVDDQARNVLDVINVGGVVDAALEPVRSIGRKVVSACSAADRIGPPERRLQVHIARIQRHGGVGAAHDSRQGFNTALVGDHADVGIDVDCLAIQQLDALACTAPAHGQPARHLVQIEYMRWPAKFEHHVVRDIDQRRDRPLSAALEPLLASRPAFARARRRHESPGLRSGRINRALRWSPGDDQRSPAAQGRSPRASAETPRAQPLRAPHRPRSNNPRGRASA